MLKTKPRKPAAEHSSGETSEEHSATDTANQGMLENFEEELVWCIDQLELGLERQNPNSKQAMEAVKILKILQSSKAPLIKKRQAMRNAFGDYRTQMRKERAKSAAAAKKMKLTTVDKTGCQKSQFFKRSSSQQSQTQSTNGLDIAESQGDNSGADLDRSFKFNFNISENLGDDLASNGSKGGIEKSNDTEKVVEVSSDSDFKMVKSENAFRFDFDISDNT